MDPTNHYNSRKEKTAQERQDDIYCCRQYNNWVKSILIQKVVEIVGSPEVNVNEPSDVSVNKDSEPLDVPVNVNEPFFILDFACGKGGDLQKWKHATANINIPIEYIGLDISNQAIKDARARRILPMDDKFDFLVQDVCVPIAHWLDPIKGRVSAISMQFAFHYACESREKMEILFTNVSDCLKPGGLFFGTAPIPERIQALFTQKSRLVSATPAPKYSNTNCQFGQAYTFWLSGAIDGCTEYLVPWDLVREMATQFGLEWVPELSVPFDTFYLQNVQKAEYKQLAQKFCFVDPVTRTLPMNQWQICCLYQTFCFRKKVKE